MDDIELRLAALELLTIELMADVDDGRRRAAAARIEQGLGEALDADESTVRRQALQLLTDAGDRHNILIRR
jgi:hypothetical protein